MQVKIQICVAVGLILLFLYIIRMIRKRSLEIRYALSWLAAIAALFVLDIFPPILGIITKLLGITLPSNLLFILGFVFFILLVITLTITVSKLSDENKTLIQEIALLRQRIEILEKEN